MSRAVRRGWAVDPSRFRGRAGPRAGAWITPPRSWDGVAQERLAAGEVADCVRRAIDGLPPPERAVIVMRDALRLRPDEISLWLGVTPAEQRALLHQARSMVRAALERHLADEEAKLV